jgi:hypothetical protein
MIEHVTYGQLDRLLHRLEFADVPVRSNWKGYRHTKSDTIILLPDRQPTAPVRAPELISVRRHLVEKAIVSEDEVDRLLTQAA